MKSTKSSLPSPTSDNSPSPSESGPSRKRARSDLTADERREARAHRNRLAAQASRDRRKAQFGHLEHRVQELEEENRRLRAGLGEPDRRRLDMDLQRIQQQERENSELRERVKVLERGWEAVVQALATHGVPAGIISPLPTSSNRTETESSAGSPPPHSSPTAFPVLVPSAPVLPLSPAQTVSSLFDESSPEITRHSAAGDFPTDLSEIQQPVPTPEETASMEEWLHEILAVQPTDIPPSDTSMVIDTKSSPSSTDATSSDWPREIEEGEAEMQRLLDLLPTEGQFGGLELTSSPLVWELGKDLLSVPGIGVF